MPRRSRVGTAAVTAVVVGSLVLVACSAPLKPETIADRATAPELGACYRLTPTDTTRSSNASEPVSCATSHTAQTFAVGTLPASTGTDYSSGAHGKWIYPRCQRAFQRFLGADESLAMRVRLSWAWFRPSQRGWDDGARWYRCDLVGGPSDADRYTALPETAKGLFQAKPPDQWLSCALGESVLDSKKVACTEPHNWRAVTTIKLGQPQDPYPGDRLAEVRSRDFCSDSVGAWMNYPVDYAFGYTWFHEAEWKAGNRRSICWARTEQ